MTERPLWPRYAEPADLPEIESVPLAERGLPESTYTLLTRAAQSWPDRTAVTVLPEAARWREPLRRTYSQLLGDVHRYANLLHEIGVCRTDAVALIAPNCAELIPATLAAQLAGVAAPINGGLSAEHLAELLRRTGARVLIAAGPELSAPVWDGARRLAADGLLDALLVLRPTGVAEPKPLEPIDGVRVGYLDELAAAHAHVTFVGQPPLGTDLAALFHTGGTTGVPKLAAHTHTGEVANAWMIAANSLLDDDSVVFAALPLFHVNALVVTLLAPLFKGQSVVWAGPLGYRDLAIYGEFWNMVAHYRLAAMSAVPTVYAVLAQCPITADISSLRYAMVGASPLPRAVRESFETHTGITLVEGYGLTEATCASARSFPDMPRPGSVGQRMPYQQVKVVRSDEEGTWTELAVGEIGVLAISGPTVFAGYVTGHDGHRHVLDGRGKLVEGWLDTGDLAHIDADGFIYLHGRAKDLIIRGGHNIDPAMIEDALLAHPQVTAVGAVGRPDVHAGEVPVAYVTVASRGEVTEAELLDWAARYVPERAAVPKMVTILDVLPITDVGKPYKLGLRADATRRELLDALAAISAVHSINTTVEDGAIVATVALDNPDAEGDVVNVLDRYTMRWNVTVR
ncbi:acyl-CoA synthetase [Nocardia gipuzkoensis]|uniref:acyl-CoA synthetase n=1 Tax=Nocardia gipuzkoensis TaxID=2749991 RepID=UPI001E3AD962|nr:acyl-CoA synthetase [Nocardia gipuzkoensis]UGT67921.1 acyl-CoA synthetase [Nocardia gipuzkoensis]